MARKKQFYDYLESTKATKQLDRHKPLCRLSLYFVALAGNSIGCWPEFVDQSYHSPQKLRTEIKDPCRSLYSTQRITNLGRIGGNCSVLNPCGTLIASLL